MNEDFTSASACSPLVEAVQRLEPHRGPEKLHGRSHSSFCHHAPGCWEVLPHGHSSSSLWVCCHRRRCRAGNRWVEDRTLWQTDWDVHRPAAETQSHHQELIRGLTLQTEEHIHCSTATLLFYCFYLTAGVNYHSIFYKVQRNHFISCLTPCF